MRLIMLMHACAMVSHINECHVHELNFLCNVHVYAYYYSRYSSMYVASTYMLPTLGWIQI